MSERTKATALDKVKDYAAEYAATKKAHDKARGNLHRWIVKGRDEGLTSTELARVAGMTAARVTQIAPVAKAPLPRSQAGSTPAPASCVTPADVTPATFATVPTMADKGITAETAAVSGIVSSRRHTRYGKATMFYRDGLGVIVQDDGTLRNAWLGFPDVDNLTANILRVVVADLPAARTVRVFLTGARPFDPTGEATMAEQVRAWALADVPTGWVGESHYLADADLPVLRFRNEDTGQRVVVMRSASWWGETDANQETCAAAWRGLGRALDNVRVFAGCGLADTPATTGRALWQRTIPDGKTYPVLSDEYRELIGSTSGQGRVELREPAAREVDRFTYLDGRLMYGSLCWGLPVGEPIRWTSADVDKWTSRDWTTLVRGRGRWRVTLTVPEGWGHVGMFGVPDAGGVWRYPSTPGETFTTWVDGHELWTGMNQAKAWDPVIHEGFSFAEGKPLDRWCKELLDLWKQSAAHESQAAQLGARAIRSVMLYTIGAFASRAHPTTHTAGLDETPDVPPGTEVRRVGDRLVWQETKPLPWPELSHPEWSATIWARARTRLLTGKGVGGGQVGALHLPPEHVIGFATDALYLAADPEWPDDGAPGRFRSKGTIGKPVHWPTNLAELHTLRDRAEAGR